MFKPQQNVDSQGKASKNQQAEAGAGLSSPVRLAVAGADLSRAQPAAELDYVACSLRRGSRRPGRRSSGAACNAARGGRGGGRCAAHVVAILGHAAPTARHEARFFSPTRARHGPVTRRPGLARPEAAGRAWAAAQACGLARHDPLQSARPGDGPASRPAKSGAPAVSAGLLP